MRFSRFVAVISRFLEPVNKRLLILFYAVSCVVQTSHDQLRAQFTLLRQHGQFLVRLYVLPFLKSLTG